MENPPIDDKEVIKQRIKKDVIISGIERRIADEQRKHPMLDWKKIAAIKIYSTYFDNKNKDIVIAVEGDFCAVCGCTEFWNNDEEEE